MITSTGWTARTAAEIRASLASRLRDTFGDPALNTGTGVFGRILDALVPEYEEVEQRMLGMYAIVDPEAVTGAAQDALYALNSLTRIPPTKSRVTVRVDVEPSVTIPAGSVVSVAGHPERRFVSLVDTLVDDNYGEVEFEAEEYGAVEAPAGTLTVIETSVTDWEEATNLLPAITGHGAESDEDFRIRRRRTLGGQGSSTVLAIRQAFAVTYPDAILDVLENPTSQVVEGLPPPHSYELIIYAPALDGADIAAVLAPQVTMGYTPVGQYIGTATVDGVEISIPYTLVSTIGLDFEVEYVGTVASEAPLVAALRAWGDAQPIGRDIVVDAARGAAYAVDGVVRITNLSINGSTTTVVIGSREKALGNGDVSTYRTTGDYS